MAGFRLPYGADFSPEKIDIIDVIKLSAEAEGEDPAKFIAKIDNMYFNNYSMASNCKNSMVSYGILERGGGIVLSQFGKKLLTLTSADEIYAAMAHQILTCLNGLIYIEAIRTIQMGGGRPSLERLASTLNIMGHVPPISKTHKALSTMKVWLEKANILNGWEINESKIEEFTGIDGNEIELLKGLSKEQIYFLRTLCNINSDDFQDSAKIRQLAEASFNIEFPAKNFSAKIINPLVDNNFIEKAPSASKHGGNAPKIKIVNSVREVIIAPVLEQIQSLAGTEVVKYCQKSLQQLRKEIDCEDAHIKGLALEAFAIRIMQIANLDFAGTRVKGSETSGAEVDVLFDSTSLNYSRWQVQCKNTDKVRVDHIAKEVGLSYILHTNMIVIITTGKISAPARQYAIDIMKQTNLCIIMIEGQDVQTIINDPTKIIDIFNRESLYAKRIKILNIDN